MSTATVSRPWGMTRMTRPAALEPLPYMATRLDRATQLVAYIGVDGKVIDFTCGTNRSFATISTSKPGDGSSSAPNVPDDSPTDNQSD